MLALKGENNPIGHMEQLWAWAPENVPGLHGEQTFARISSEYHPAAQGEHSDALMSEYVPGRQSVQVVALDCANVPWGQELQIELPDVTVKVPAMHVKHAPSCHIIGKG